MLIHGLTPPKQRYDAILLQPKIPGLATSWQIHHAYYVPRLHICHLSLCGVKLTFVRERLYVSHVYWHKPRITKITAPKMDSEQSECSDVHKVENRREFYL